MMPSWKHRRLMRAQQRARQGYPAVMRGWGEKAPISVSDGDWVSQFDAADALHVGLYRVGSLIANGHLRAAENSTGEAGVTRASLEQERRWRSSASPFRKTVRLIRDWARWL